MKCEKCSNEAAPGHAECSECVGKAVERVASLDLPGVYFVSFTKDSEGEAPEAVRRVIQRLRDKV